MPLLCKHVEHLFWRYVRNTCCRIRFRITNIIMTPCYSDPTRQGWHFVCFWGRTCNLHPHCSIFPPQCSFCNTNICPLNDYSDWDGNWWMSWESWERLGLCWELLVLGKMKWLGPGPAYSARTPARIMVDYSTELWFASPMSFPKFHPCYKS